MTRKGRIKFVEMLFLIVLGRSFYIYILCLYFALVIPAPFLASKTSQNPPHSTVSSDAELFYEITKGTSTVSTFLSLYKSSSEKYRKSVSNANSGTQKVPKNRQTLMAIRRIKFGQMLFCAFLERVFYIYTFLESSDAVSHNLNEEDRTGLGVCVCVRRNHNSAFLKPHV